jgi:hypothetical protein
LTVKPDPKGGKAAKTSKPKEPYELQQARILQLEGRLMKLKAIRDKDFPMGGSAYSGAVNTSNTQSQAVDVKDIPKSISLDDRVQYFDERDIQDLELSVGQEILRVERSSAYKIDRLLIEVVYFVAYEIERGEKKIIYCNKKSDLDNPQKMSVTKISVSDDKISFALPKLSAPIQ